MSYILAAIIAAAGGIITSLLANSETEKAQQEARQLANQQREDTLFMNNEQVKLTKEGQKLQKRRIEYNRDAELYGRKERAVERGMVARENNFGKSLALVNSNDTLRASFLNNWTRRAV